MAEPNEAPPAPKGHDHGHGHGHDHAHGAHGHAHAPDDLFAHPHSHAEPEKPGFEQELDPANRALNDALRVSFAVLKVVMVVLVLAFLFGRWVEVKEGEAAIRLRFGAVQGEAGHRVLEPGWHFALPEGVDRIVKLPTTEQRISLDKEFWFEVKPGDETKDLAQLKPAAGGLVPGKDGSLLTADKNIVHGQWLVAYRIDKRQAEVFARNTGTLENAEQLVRNAAERAIVQVLARTSADAFVGASIDLPGIRTAIQETLGRLEAGMTVTDVLLKNRTPPLAVRGDFSAVSSAESERGRKLADARTAESKLLIDTAGPRYGVLLETLDHLRDVRAGGDPSAIEAAERRVQEQLSSEHAQGRVYAIIQEAEQYRTRIVENVRAEADTFKRLLPQYLENPRIFREKLLQDALQEVFGGDVEKFYLPPDTKELYLELNRDPQIRREKERERYKLAPQPPKP